MQVKFRLAVVVMMALALVGCQGEQATVTGGYGASVVTGQVIMVDGSSPAGVTVTLGGTGMSKVVAADGQFAFAAAPEGAELQFTRATDGIAASMKLDAKATHVVVELANSSARKSSKRRGSGSGGTAVEIEGVVRSASATQVVVFTSKGVEQTIAIAADTIIRKGNTVLTAADLVADTRVHVKARKTDTGFSAVAIIVQGSGSDDDDAPEGREYEGTVVSATAGQLVLIDAKGVQQTFVLNAATEIRKGNTPVLATELQAGSRVHVKATTAADGTKTATRVIVQKTNGIDDGGAKVKLTGKVTAVAAGSLTVQAGGASVTVQTDASTVIRKKKADVALTAIVAGDV
ncbi:MAG TPA: DUF5666 domain-containing protein, partial [Thermoanaerobaculia bacterium]|nr:DUF5666 domain-containing protein [Thermoanaerobaculia bacterium]